jgi:hypothetical protein
MTTTDPNFRQMARESLARAKAELAAQDADRLKYAALELREAMESLTYERARAFQDDIAPEEYKTWQPRKLMAVLVDIDPSIGLTSTIALGPEEEYGKPAPQASMTVLGTDHVFGLAALKAHYDAFGSYLHVPSLDQLRSGSLPNLAKLRERCETVIGLVEKVLESRVWNVTLGASATLEQCMNDDCRKPVRKRIPFGKQAFDAQCFDCKAEYSVLLEPDGGVLWRSKTTDVPCSTQGCPEKMELWPHEVKQGTHWRCRGCSVHNGILLSVSKIEDKDPAAASEAVGPRR